METKEVLKLLRKSKGYTNMKDFCEVVDISINTYQNYESGKRIPTADILIKLADFYGVTTDYLLGRETNNPFDGIILDEEDTKLLVALAKLPSNIRKCTFSLLLELVKETQKNQD